MLTGSYRQENAIELWDLRMNEKFSFIEVEQASSDKVLNGLQGSNHDGRSLRAEFAKPRK